MTKTYIWRNFAARDMEFDIDWPIDFDNPCWQFTRLPAITTSVLAHTLVKLCPYPRDSIVGSSIASDMRVGYLCHIWPWARSI
jgi:hypothetical protein